LYCAMADNLPPPCSGGVGQRTYKYQFMKLEEWRKHPGLRPTLKNLFPGFPHAVVLFSVYCVVEHFFLPDYSHHSHDDHGHGAEHH